MQKSRGNAGNSSDGPTALDEGLDERQLNPAADAATDPSPSHPRSGRDRRGRFALGNAKSLKHGRFSRAVARALLPEQAETLAVLADHEAAILVDLGGATELSTFEKDLTRKYMALDALAQFNAPRMLSSRASVRAQAVNTFMAAIDRQLKIIGLLGMSRRQKNINDLDNISDYLRAQQAQDQDSDALALKHDPEDR